MVVAKSIAELRELRGGLSGNVGFVPTMGALHNGHISLMKRARGENDSLIVSIFVNPTQFLEGEDLDTYPSKVEADTKICELAGVDILFMPSIDDMYESDELHISAPAVRGYILEGQKRPGHFDGMLQIVMKLLNLSTPTRAYFGKKDAQQLALITQMVKNYFLDIEIIPCEIVRDSNGLALSSRNTYLDREQKSRALALSGSLRVATDMVIAGELDSGKIMHSMIDALEAVDRVEYVAIVNREFNKLDRVEVGDSIILVAAWVGETRLIDNIWI